MHRGELLLYAAVVAFTTASFAWKGYRYSLQFEAGARWDGYAPGLRQGWLLGRRVDLSDVQWREFRAGLPLLAAALAAFAAVSRAARPATLRARAVFHLACALGLLGYLHGTCAAYVLALAAANFWVARLAAGTRFGAAAIWAYNIAALLAARLSDGRLAAALPGGGGPLAAALDAHRGAVRWEICYNLTMLRMVSFALDLHWARRRRQQQQGQQQQQQQQGQQAQRGLQEEGTHIDAAEAKALTPPPPGSDELAAARWRQRTPLSGPPAAAPARYGLLPYLAYCLYPPLYLAGPILTYQDYAWQLAQGRRPPGRTVLRYGLRLGADLAALELLTHLLYFNALAKSRVGPRYAPHGLAFGSTEIGLTGFWVLAFMWLKFAAIWRFFRLAALAEGVEPPENMARCFANNYDAEGFWRGWHASYNRWLVRYIYVPLGGSARRLATIWPVFLFVALWHDLEWRLVGWAVLICLGFVPELLAKRAAAGVAGSKLRAARPAAFRCACAAAAALNIAALMAANLAGFVLGLDGLGAFLAGLASDPGFVAAALAVFFCAAQLMYALRAGEAARAERARAPA